MRAALYITIVFLSFVSNITAYKNHHDNARTASAVFYNDDGMWGSVVFHQWDYDGPVVIGIKFFNLDTRGEGNIHYSIHDEPVHYDRHTPENLCKEKNLLQLLKGADDEVIGNLSERHQSAINRKKNAFSTIIHDNNITLFRGYPGYIINKSFLVKQGNSSASHKCSTIELSNLHSQRAGMIPCEFATYSDCLVGAAKSNNTCVFSACFGFRRLWSKDPLDGHTLMCKQIYETYPQLDQPVAHKSGVVPCTHGTHSLLKPISRDYDL